MSNKEVEDSRKEGKRCIEEKKYIEAMLHYTKAIKLSPKDSKLYSNRSLAFLRIQQHFHALEDAMKCIELEPSWAKGHFRRGEVEYDTGHFQEAMESYRTALTKDPKNKELAEALRKATAAWKKQTKSESRKPWLGGGFGLVLSILMVVFDDYVLEKSVIGNDVLKFVLALAFIAVGFGISYAYVILLQSQRCSLLEPPVDLFSEMGLDDSSSGNNSSSTSPKPATEKKTSGTPGTSTRKRS